MGLAQRLQALVILPVALFIVIMSTTTHASNIVVSSSSSGTQYIASDPESGTADMLVLAPPNASGVSVNHFDSLQIDQPLKLINAPKQTYGTTNEPARLIVIVANTIFMDHIIDIVGPASDILFITGAGGSIQCGTCEINNAYRVTLAAGAKSELSDSIVGDITGQVSEIDTLATFLPSTTGGVDTAYIGAATIGALSAPGALSLDIIAPQVSVTNFIDLNETLSKNANGGYFKDIDGQYLAGTGQINILSGAVRWDYEEQSVESYSEVNPGYTSAISGDLFAYAASVIATHDLSITGKINTRTDLLATVRYQNKVQAAEEAISIQMLGAVGNLTVTNQLYTNANIDIRSMTDIRLQSGADLSSTAVRLTSAENIINKGQIATDHFQAAAKSILNRGKMDAFYAAEIWTEKHLINEFGGVISARNVVIEAEGFVRNGARCRPATDDNFETFCEEVTRDTSYLSGEKYFDTDWHKSSWGASDGNGWDGKPAQTHSHILGDVVHIKAAYLENTNPYWEYAESNGTFLFDRRLISQVSIDAEHELRVNVAEHVLNASALIRMNNPEGLLSMKANIISNERFKVRSFLNRDYEFMVTSDGSSTTETEKEIYGLEVLIYSPPGFILSMGNFQADGAGFVNNTAYFEVFGDAHFNLGTLNSIGVEMTGIGTESVEVTTEEVVSFWGGRFTNTVTDTSNDREMFPEDPREYDSLFYIKGATYGMDYDAIEIAPFDLLLNKVTNWIESRLDSRLASVIRNAQGTIVSNRTYNDGIYKLTWSDKICEGVGTWPNCGCRRVGKSFRCGTTTASSGSYTINLWNELENFWQDAKAEVQTLMNNITRDWWN